MSGQIMTNSFNPESSVLYLFPIVFIEIIKLILISDKDKKTSLKQFWNQNFIN